MKYLNICIDIDGTITDPYFWLDIANKHFKKNVSIQEITQYRVDQVMGVTRKEYIDFYNKNKFELHNGKEPIRKDAIKIIQKLIKTNNIYFVTAREKDLEILTHYYLNKHNIPYDGVFVLGTSYKVDTAINLNCDVFIEDCYENALELSKNGFKTLLIDTNYNRVPLNKNITRVFNWNEIYGILEKMLLQKKVI
ncbi:5' nucleotidase, NT5C type [Clostridium sp. WILCCON 0269]|uniref:Nucleotidase n=1 Tax=Candidatus Clostridium eludens TaxID=3381663 RepID=A0ABW8SEV2_9CLOT